MRAMDARGYARLRSDDASEFEQPRADGRSPDRTPRDGASASSAFPAAVATPAQALLRLQRTAGNGAVVQLLRAGSRPAVPVQRADEDEWDGGGGDQSEAPAGAGGTATDAGERSAADMERKANEGNPSGQDEEVPMEGGAAPYAPVATPGFHDLGRRGTVPFGHVDAGSSDPEEASHPHAYTGGGRTGTVPWSGGGPGGGPKGNQGTGSIQMEVVPQYDSRSNGPTTNADVWVRSGTGIADVKRDYVGSAAGDQGNGWWISAAAATALEAHEKRHVTASKEVYGSTIQPMLDRMADSENLGKGKTYWASDGIALLQRQIGWADALKKFKEEDAQYNANQGQVDQQDFGTSHYPRNMNGPRTIGGKEYQTYLIMGSEPDPT
jgi:hypothetical protein